MEYRPRASGIGPRSQMPAPKPRQQEKQHDPLAYLILPPGDIVKSLNELDIPFQLDSLNNPNPQHICLIMEQMLDQLTGINNLNATPIITAILQENENRDTLSDSMKVLACFRALRNVLNKANFTDFKLTDLLNPETERLKRMLSVMINLRKYQDERKPEVEQFSVEGEQLQQRMEELYAENDELGARLEELREKREGEKGKVEKVMQEYEVARSELKRLHEMQGSLSMDNDKLKTQKIDLKKKLERSNEEKIILMQDCEKLRPYIVDSPHKLQQANSDMSTTLSSEKSQIAAIERKSRAYFTSADSFSVIEADVNACIKVMEECESELLREEEDLKKAQRHRDVLRKKGLEVQDWEKKESMLNARLVVTQDKVVQARKAAETKKGVAKSKMTELEKLYKKLAAERNEKSVEVDRTKEQINKVERMIESSKEQFEDEVRNANVEFAKLNNHITRYMNEMHKMMGVVN